MVGSKQKFEDQATGSERRWAIEAPDFSTAIWIFSTAKSDFRSQYRNLVEP
jgi:hypothetical protein